jgi:hypothetical protein
MKIEYCIPTKKIMTRLFLLAFLSISLFSGGQNNYNTNIDSVIDQDSVIYVKKCIAFIREIRPQELSDTTFVLSDKPFSFEYFECIEELLTDTATYTKEELSFIKEKQHPSLIKWTKDLFRNTRLVSGDTINAIFKDNSKWWTYFNKHIGHGFNTFSVPIFLRNDDYCLFYSDHHCGGRCGSGRLTLYKKENNRWIKVKFYCGWVS